MLCFECMCVCKPTHEHPHLDGHNLHTLHRGKPRWHACWSAHGCDSPSRRVRVRVRVHVRVHVRVRVCMCTCACACACACLHVHMRASNTTGLIERTGGRLPGSPSRAGPKSNPLSGSSYSPGANPPRGGSIHVWASCGLRPSVRHCRTTVTFPTWIGRKIGGLSTRALRGLRAR